MYDILNGLVIRSVESVTSIYTKENTGMARKNRERWGIIFKYEGETEYLCSGKRILSDNHNLAVLPKGCSYTWNCTKAGHFYAIEFDSESTHDRILSFPVKDFAPFLHRFREMERKALYAKPFASFELMAGVYGILAALTDSLQKMYVSGDKRAKIAPAVEYMVENYDKSGVKISNRTLAALCGCSEVYFRKLFTEIYGCSPIRYATGLRISKAKEILSSDYGRVGDVAQMLGYGSIYEFTRAFKAYTGLSPRAYGAKK